MADLVTQAEILSEIKNLSTEMGYTGTAVDVINNILAFAEYKNLTRCTSVSLESSFQYCEELNTKIEHARSRCYSVFRGKNQRFTIKNLTPITNFSVEKYDVAATVNGMNLYYARSYSFNENSTAEIELILGKELMTLSKLKQSSQIIYYSDSDVSEDVQVLLEGEEQPIYDDFQEYIEQGHLEEGALFILTDKDYGISVIDQYDLTVGGNYVTRAIKYEESTIESSIIKSIPQFKFTSTGGSYDTVIEETPFEKRNTDLDNIFLNATIAWKSGFVVRSSYDFPDIIKSVLQNTCKAVNLVIDYVGTEEHPQGSIVVHYLMEDFGEIPESVVQRVDDIKKAYYINQDIILEQAEPTEIYLPLDVYYSGETPNRTTIENLINEYQYQIGGVYNAYIIQAALIELDGIDRVEFGDNINTLKSELQYYQYPKFSPLEVTFYAS